MGHIKSIADELASIGRSVTPEEYTDAILVGLSLEYAPTIKSKYEMPQITVERLFSLPMSPATIAFYAQLF